MTMQTQTASKTSFFKIRRIIVANGKIIYIRRA